MDNGTHICFNAEDRSYFAILKKEIHNLAIDAGLGAKRAAEADIVVAEMTSNLIKHAGGGEILARMLHEGDNVALELICIDNGPGMSDTAKMMEDGMSTSRTLGQGLGAIKRLSHVFQIYSLKGWGTVLLVRIYKNAPSIFVKPLADVRSLVVAKPGEQLSGDGALYMLDKNCLKIFLGDGLGHGPDANAAVQKAISTLKLCAEREPVDLLRILHREVKRTRGLVGTMAIYDFRSKRWSICGIGNIATRIVGVGQSKSYLSYNGIIGLNIPGTMAAQEVETDRGGIVVMCSDGIRTRWEIQKYIGVLRYDPSVLAAIIYKDFARKTDDMSVLVAKINGV